MSQRLTRARFHGYLRYGSTDEVICTPATVNAMVERGWLKPWRATYEITREGKRTEWELVITLGLSLDGFFEFGAPTVSQRRPDLACKLMFLHKE
jgi:hypothetical protein